MYSLFFSFFVDSPQHCQVRCAVAHSGHAPSLAGHHHRRLRSQDGMERHLKIDNIPFRRCLRAENALRYQRLTVARLRLLGRDNERWERDKGTTQRLTRLTRVCSMCSLSFPLSPCPLSFSACPPPTASHSAAGCLTGSAPNSGSAPIDCPRAAWLAVVSGTRMVWRSARTATVLALLLLLQPPTQRLLLRCRILSHAPCEVCKRTSLPRLSVLLPLRTPLVTPLNEPPFSAITRRSPLHSNAWATSTSACEDNSASAPASQVRQHTCLAAAFHPPGFSVAYCLLLCFACALSRCQRS